MLIFADKEKQEIQKEISEQIESTKPEKAEEFIDLSTGDNNKNYGFRKIPFINNSIPDWHLRLNNYNKRFTIESVSPDNFVPGPNEVNILQNISKIGEEYWKFISNFFKIIDKYNKFLINYNDIIRGFVNKKGEERYLFIKPEQVKDLTNQILKYQKTIYLLIENYKKLIVEIDNILKDFFTNFPESLTNLLYTAFNQHKPQKFNNYNSDDISFLIDKSNKQIEQNIDPRHFAVEDPYSDFDEEDHLDLLAPNFYVPGIKIISGSSLFLKEKQNTHKFYQKLLEIKQKIQQSEGN